IAKILFHLDQINFDLDNTESDVLGDAYEYLIGQFAANAGKKAGEFYTPQQVSKILAKIVTTGKSKLKSVYDPTCGSGSLLLRVTKEVDNVSHFYGQESIHTTYNLARMNMILHDVHYRKFDIKQEDTLERPQHINESFEAIVANPPFSAKWSANELHMSDDRFSQYGRLAPKSKADFAFIQHMIHQLDENGIMAIVCPPGVLYRGAAEGHIRKYLIEDKNYLDAVIGLPENIFYGTGIPTCILVFKKCREDSGNILFIDASNEFKKVKPKNKLISENINKIVNTYRNRKVIQKYSHLASLDEVKGNGYNLNISRYIDAFVRGKAVNLNNIVELSIELDRLSVKNDKRLGEYCAELDLPFPQGNNKNLLKQFRKSITQKIFNQEIRFKSDSGGDFPNWTEKVLGNIGNTFNGLTGKTKKDFGFGKPFIEYVQIFNSTKININNFGLVDVKDDENQKTAQYGDIFFTTSSETPDEVGYSSVLLDVVVDELYLNSFCFGFRPNSPDEINPKFSQYLFRSDEFRRQVRRLAQGSTRYNISKIELMKTAIELPSLKEQIRIAEFLSSIDKKIEQIESQIDASLQNENKLIHRIFE
ncbi:MAG: type I restriction-modification system subunit M, partial [Candidatus Ruthia sp.]|nr:type I restriction-modification system subunit M [Candidatus Ruthturnera sp.]